MKLVTEVVDDKTGVGMWRMIKKLECGGIVNERIRRFILQPTKTVLKCFEAFVERTVFSEASFISVAGGSVVLCEVRCAW